MVVVCLFKTDENYTASLVCSLNENNKEVMHFAYYLRILFLRKKIFGEYESAQKAAKEEFNQTPYGF